MIASHRLPHSPPVRPCPFDSSAAADSDSGIFGLGLPLEECRFVAIPVPYDATCSKHHGTVDGPRTLIESSRQVDLFDPVVGEVCSQGIGSLPELEQIRALSAAAQSAAHRSRGGDRAAGEEVDRAGQALAQHLEETVGGLLDSGRVPLVIGGEHGLSLGPFRAVARRHPGVGILQIDAHADLRRRYEGWGSSHASIMARALELSGVSRLCQVGLRDFCREEWEQKEAAGERAIWFTDASISAQLCAGVSFRQIAEAIVAALPDRIWISFDIDGLDPSLCPGTGTPVPGGLSWQQATALLLAVKESRKRILGIDLVEIGATDWDGFVAAKLLYLLAGIAA